MWSIIQEQDVFWYFDATGSVLVKVPQQKAPLLYSVVAHDRQRKLIIPIAEFITTSQTQISISGYLAVLRKHMHDNITSKGKFAISPIIVTDFSWALINSVLDVFNKCTVMEYLKMCFKILREGDLNLNQSLPVRIQLCAAHFLKVIVNCLKKLNVDAQLKSDAIFCFSLLQNASSLHDFERLPINIFNIFNQKQLNDSCIATIAFIRNELKSRSIIFSSNCEVDQKRNLKKELFNQDFTFRSTETFTNLKNNSQ